MYKYLPGFLIVVIIAALSMAFTIHKKISYLLITKNTLEEEVANLGEAYNPTVMVQPAIPTSVETTYDKLYQHLKFVCTKLGIEASIKIPNLPDYKTPRKFIKPSTSMRGVKELSITLISSADSRSVFYLISNIRNRFPVVFDEVGYNGKNWEAKLKLYGI